MELPEAMGGNQVCGAEVRASPGPQQAWAEPSPSPRLASTGLGHEGEAWPQLCARPPLPLGSPAQAQPALCPGPADGHMEQGRHLALTSWTSAWGCRAWQSHHCPPAASKQQRRVHWAQLHTGPVAGRNRSKVQALCLGPPPGLLLQNRSPSIQV